MTMITVGADPEFFIRDRRTGGVVPVCGLLGGTKKSPKKLTGAPEGFFVQEDNVMAEFNVPPAKGSEQFSLSITRGLRSLERLVRTRSENKFEIDYASTRLFTLGQLDDPRAAVFGCSPENDAYNIGRAAPRLEREQLETDGGEYRCAGGHLHMGFASTTGMHKPALPPPFVMAQFADLFLALPFCGLDKQGKRRELYGRAGRYRETSYGIEYRTLSNFWVFDRGLSRTAAQYVIHLGQYLSYPEDNKVRESYQEVPWKDVQSCINEEDENTANELIPYLVKDLKIPLCQLGGEEL